MADNKALENLANALMEAMDDIAKEWMADPINKDFCRALLAGDPTDTQFNSIRHIFKAGYIKGRNDTLIEIANERDAGE